MKKLWIASIVLAISMLYLDAADARRGKRPENRQPEMTRAQSQMNDALDLAEKAHRNAYRNQKRTLDLIEQGQKQHEEAVYNGLLYERNKAMRKGR